MSDRAGLFDRILASLYEVALVLGLAPLPGTEAAQARPAVKRVSDTGWAMHGDRRKIGERR